MINLQQEHSSKHSKKQLFTYWSELDQNVATLTWNKKDEMDKLALTHENEVDSKKESVMVKCFDCGCIQVGNMWTNLHFASDNNPENFLSGKNSDSDLHYNMKGVTAYAKPVQDSDNMEITAQALCTGRFTNHVQFTKAIKAGYK